MSVPVGPHGSLLVAEIREPPAYPNELSAPTIADLDLDVGIPFGHVLDPPDNLRHIGDRCSALVPVKLCKCVRSSAVPFPETRKVLDVSKAVFLGWRCEMD